MGEDVAAALNKLLEGLKLSLDSLAATKSKSRSKSNTSTKPGRQALNGMFAQVSIPVEPNKVTKIISLKEVVESVTGVTSLTNNRFR